MYTLNWQPPYDWSWMFGISRRPCGERRGKQSRTVIMPVVWR